MDLDRTKGPDDGSMTVVFHCPDCGRETAMLTNAMETQVVRSLGVSIGGRQDAPEPMETLRTRLRSDSGERPEPSGEEQAVVRPGDGRSGAPHPSFARSASSEETGEETGASAGEPESGDSAESESKCPFTGMVEEAFAEAEDQSTTRDRDRDRTGAEDQDRPGDRSAGSSPAGGGNAETGEDGPIWTEAAEQRLERIPPMARSFARTGIEEYAREEGITRIDESVMDAVKGRFSL